MKEKGRMPFGKHKGKLYEELPDEYAAWLLHDDILIPPLREKLEEAIWKKLQKNCAWDSKHKKELLKDWVDYYYKSRRRSFKSNKIISGRKDRCFST
jgi:hypothetical protein